MDTPKEEIVMKELRGNSSGKVSRLMYLLLGVLFAIGVIMQVMLAGMATFIDGLHWARHSMLIHAFGFNIPLFMLVAAFFGKMPRFAYWQVFGSLLLVFLLYFTANMRGTLPIVAALHPVIAMVLFMFSTWIVYKSWAFILSKS